MKKLQVGCGKKGAAEFVLMGVADKNGYVEAKGAEPLTMISED